MNGRPHVHTIDICVTDHYMIITYGDTQRTIENFRSEQAIKRIIKRIIKQHDKGSKRAARAAQRRQDDYARFISAIPTLTDDSWGSEQIRQK